MNNELEKALAKAVEQGLELAEKTGEFVIDQAPDLLQQFYAWHLWSNILGIVFSVALFLAGRYSPLTFLSTEKAYWDTKFFNRYGDTGGMLAWIIFLTCSIISATTFFVSVYNVAFITIAPKLYLIDYFLK